MFKQVNMKVKPRETEVPIYLHNDIVDWDVNQLDKEANKSHDGKANCCRHGNLLELCKKKTNTSV